MARTVGFRFRRIIYPLALRLSKGEVTRG